MFSSGSTMYSKIISTLHALLCSAREIRLNLVQRVSEGTACVQCESTTFPTVSKLIKPLDLCKLSKCVQ